MDNPIRKALENLPGHWHQGSLGDGNGNYCGIGHLKLAMFGENGLDYSGMKGEGWVKYAKIMNDVAGEQYPERAREFSDLSLGPSFAAFNDHPRTTEDEVITVMEKAAILVDEQI